MPLRAILRYLLNNEQLIQKLSDSYPIRRAAQLTAFMLFRGREAGEEAIKKLQEELKQSGGKISSFKETFSKEMKEQQKKQR